MKCSRAKLPDNIVKQVKWKFVNGSIQLVVTKYLEIYKDGERRNKDRAIEQEFIDLCSNADEQNMVKSSNEKADVTI